MEDIGAADILEKPAKTNAIPKPAVSVIVPVYNVEAYLRRCVDSLLNQTLQEIEIILVDDGSTDRCGLICDEYARQDDRIFVIHQKNAGLSNARNAGIDQARANYLMFVDSDDWVEPGFCKIPLTIALEQQADLVMFQFRRIRNGHTKTRNYRISEGIKSEKEALRLLMSGVGMAAWNKLYQHALFQHHRYPSGKVYEDTILTPLLVHEASKIIYSPAVLYNQIYRKGSITTVLSPKNEQDWLDAKALTVQGLEEWGFEQEAEAFYRDYTMSFIGRERYHHVLCKQYIRYFRELKHCPASFSKKRKILYYMLKLSPVLFSHIYKTYIRLRT